MPAPDSSHQRCSRLSQALFALARLAKRRNLRPPLILLNWLRSPRHPTIPERGGPNSRRDPNQLHHRLARRRLLRLRRDIRRSPPIHSQMDRKGVGRQALRHSRDMPSLIRRPMDQCWTGRGTAISEDISRITRPAILMRTNRGKHHRNTPNRQVRAGLHRTIAPLRRHLRIPSRGGPRRCRHPGRSRRHSISRTHPAMGHHQRHPLDLTLG